MAWMSGTWNKHMSYRVLVLSGLKTALTVTDNSAIRTKDGSYCGNDLSQKRSLQWYRT